MADDAPAGAEATRAFYDSLAPEYVRIFANWDGSVRRQGVFFFFFFFFFFWDWLRLRL